MVSSGLSHPAPQSQLSSLGMELQNVIQVSGEEKKGGTKRDDKPCLGPCPGLTDGVLLLVE